MTRLWPSTEIKINHQNVNKARKWGQGTLELHLAMLVKGCGLRLVCSFFLLLSVISSVKAAGAHDNDEYEEPREGKRDMAEHDFAIYDLLDRMNTLTPQFSTLYELLQVTPSSSAEEASRQFRRLSFQYHPDKLNQKSSSLSAEELKRRTGMFALYSGAVEILKSQSLRARYEWLLNDAPPWHRSQVYLWHNIRAKRQQQRRGKLEKVSLLGALGVILTILTAAQFVLQWVRYLASKYWIWSGKRAFNSIPIKEVRRMEKKALRNDLTYLAYTDSNFENMAAARSKGLPMPLPTDLFIFSIPVGFVKYLWALVRGRSRGHPKRAEEKVKSG